MEFIPLERYSKKTKSKESTEEQKGGKNKKLKEIETEGEVTIKQKKPQKRTKVLEKKNVKNKYKETLALKQKKRVPKKKTQKKKKGEEEDDDEEVEEEEEKEVQMDVDDGGNEEEEDEEEGEEEEEDDEEEEKNNDEEAFKRKCQEMDEKKKNRLFVKLNKKILNKAQIKELHPDIRDVIFPRKRNSRWCWAVFASEERADDAMKQLIKKKDVLVSKPTPYDRVDLKKKQKMKTVLRKKEARKKLQKMWM